MIDASQWRAVPAATSGPGGGCEPRTARASRRGFAVGEWGGGFAQAAARPGGLVRPRGAVYDGGRSHPRFVQSLAPRQATRRAERDARTASARAAVVIRPVGVAVGARPMSSTPFLSPRRPPAPRADRATRTARGPGLLGR